MANAQRLCFPLLFLTLLCSTVFILVQGSRVQISIHHQKGTYHIPTPERALNPKEDSRRLLIGSVAPTCTYNECRGCKYRCRAEQVPVEGNSPMNSAYHYKCICHR